MQLLCNIGYTSGLRLSEALGLTIEQVRRKECSLRNNQKVQRRTEYMKKNNHALIETFLCNKIIRKLTEHKGNPRATRTLRHTDD